MSRHKDIKNLDLDAELDDYDGYDDDDDSEELSPEDKEKSRQALAEVRKTLGTDIGVGDAEIQDSLYYYYFDVPKTINYILNQQTKSAKAQKTAKKPKTGATTRTPQPESEWTFLSSNWPNTRIVSTGTEQEECENLEWRDHGDHSSTFLPSATLPSSRSSRNTLNFEDFFHDCPWLNIPASRRAHITLEPLMTLRGLLGGSSGAGNDPPKSKLAKLAAARRQENEKLGASSPSRGAASVALLDRLTISGKRPSSPADQENKPCNPGSSSLPTTPNATAERLAKLRAQRRQDDIVKSQPMTDDMVQVDDTVMDENEEYCKEETRIAKPSIFAQAIFSSAAKPQYPVQSFASNDRSLIPCDANTNDNPFSDPSPDDIILKAQSHAKGPRPKQNTSNPPKTKDAESASTAMTNLNITSEKPKIASQNIDVGAEYAKTKRKRTANFVVIGKLGDVEVFLGARKHAKYLNKGHVDAGKSTLMGRLLHDLKVIDRRTIDKYQKEADKLGKGSFAYAWVMDQGSEERARGVTIDVAQHRFDTENTAFTILDAPGHRDFIPNMIGGASQADFALLVIDASPGSFESGLRGQTKEHALLVRSIGISRIVIAVNKIDAAGWAQDRFDEITQQLTAFLSAAGFPASQVSSIPCSGLTGDNVVAPSHDVRAKWYQGQCLLQALEPLSNNDAPAISQPLRMTIDDVFRGGIQYPLSISGRLERGNVQVGDVVLIQPDAQKATIKAVEADGEPDVSWAVSGQNVILHLIDIDAQYLKSGDVVCSVQGAIPCVKEMTIKILAFEHIMPMHCEILRGRLNRPGRVTRLLAILDKSTGQVVGGSKKPRLIKPGAVARVQVEADAAMPVELGNRVILRADGQTVGTGIVE